MTSESSHSLATLNLTINQESVRAAGSNLARKDKLPIGFYSGNGPAPQWRFVEPACQPSETGIPIIGKLTLGIVMMEDEAEARAGSRSRRCEEGHGRPACALRAEL